MNTCFFIGHREAPQSLLPKLREAVEEEIISQQMLHFVVGHYGNFDAAGGAGGDGRKKAPPGGDAYACYCRIPVPQSRWDLTGPSRRRGLKRCPGGLPLCMPTGT